MHDKISKHQEKILEKILKHLLSFFQEKEIELKGANQIIDWQMGDKKYKGIIIIIKNQKNIEHLISEKIIKEEINKISALQEDITVLMEIKNVNGNLQINYFAPNNNDGAIMVAFQK